MWFKTLLANWYWAALALLAVWVAVLKLEVAGLTLDAQKERTKAAEQVAAAKQQIIDFKTEEDRRNLSLSQEFANTVSELRLSIGQSNAAIQRTGSTRDCVRTDAVRAFTGGVRQQPPTAPTALQPASAGSTQLR